jgi:DNA-binding YbaB/EbfC family protein
MKNLGNLMKQAQQMQARMEEMQAKLAAAEITGQSGGGMVSITLNGKGIAKSVKIDRGLIDPGDPEVLEDLIVAAINDARGKLDSYTQEKMSEVTGGLQLPGGLKLPF